jgi:predicted aldo/keto reductase-like oxidoreductase
MCPVAGGALASGAEAVKQALGLDLPTPEMALRFVLSNPHVSTACSGMSTLDQLEQNVQTANGFDPEKDGRFEEMCAGLDRLRASFAGGFCTACGYCRPCPQGVDIPRYMGIHQNWKAFGLEEHAAGAMQGVNPDKSLLRCDACGACEAKCPNGLPIREKLAELKARFPPRGKAAR